MALNYEKPKVRVEQTFEDLSPELVPTDLVPNVTAPQFTILNQEAVAEEPNGYAGNLLTAVVPMPAETAVDMETIEVYLNHPIHGQFLIDESKWTFYPDTNELELDPDIEITVDGEQISFNQENQASVEVDMLAMWVRRPEQDIDEVQKLINILSVDGIESKAGAIDPKNPLAWGMFFTSLGTDAVVTGMPVLPETDDITLNRLDEDGDPASKANGGTYYHYLDLTAYEKALGQLELYEVWSITTNFPENDKYFNDELKGVLIDTFLQHCEEMSKPENQKERIVTMINPADDPTLDSKFKRAQELRDFANSYNSRRLSLVVPDTVEVPVEGTFEILDAEVLCNLIAGMDSFFDPQQPFTRLAMPGPINRIVGSNNIYRESQLDTIAAGGNYIVKQDIEGAAPYSRHQQTTHTQFIEKNERSIIKVVDYAAKFMRSELRPFVGRYNVTDNTISEMRTTASGVIAEMVSAGTIRSGSIQTLRQNESEPDGTVLKFSITVLYPNNDIDVEILV